jgi:hypothetical protein
VSVVGAAGDLVDGAFDAVTVALVSGTGVLSGTATVSARNRVATFSDLIITGSGTFTLRFSAPTSIRSARRSRCSGGAGMLRTTTSLRPLTRMQFCVTSSSCRSPQQHPLPNGDANCDGAVNAVDAAIVLALRPAAT